MTELLSENDRKVEIAGITDMVSEDVTDDHRGKIRRQNGKSKIIMKKSAIYFKHHRIVSAELSGSGNYHRTWLPAESIDRQK